MTTEFAIDAFLRKVQSAPNESLVAYSNCFDGFVPGDEPEIIWQGVCENEAATMRAVIRMGLVSSKFHRWVPDYEGELISDGGDYVITLSGVGTEKLIILNEPFLRKAKKQIVANLPTILTSTLISLIGAWAIFLWGPNK